MTLMNSLNNPLMIATIEVPDSKGLIGMTICPGKHQKNALSGQFQRDLYLDLDLIKSWGASAVVSLMTDEELTSLKVEKLGIEVEARSMLWFQLPIIDQALPDEAFERSWVYAGLRLRTLLREGKHILVHCRSGLGRTGLIAARLLIELGMPVEKALSEICQVRPGSLKLTSQEQYLSNIQIPHNDHWLDRVLGCLIGGAVGDAFGYTVEFDSLEKICQRFGKLGLTKPVFQQGKLVVSDDTQMTLFTLEGILRCTDERGELVSSDVLEEIRHAYLDWYDTQQASPEAHGSLYGWLAEQPTLRMKRAPGNTCLSSLKNRGKGTIETPINDSKGCGGVMRTAPVGFLKGIDLFDLGGRAAALTHGHIDGWVPAGVLPRIVARLTNGEEKFLAVRNGYSDACEWGHVYGKAANTDLFCLARKLARKMRFNPCEAIRQIGEGWVGDEALAVGIYAFLSARNFKDAVSRAANHDGDSDSTASITGQLWGAKYGLRDIPQEWVRRLDVLDEILYLVQHMQSWHRQADTEAFRKPVIDDVVLSCIRMIEMTHELHVLGYQKIRIFPYLSPSGCYWRIEWAPDSAFRSATEPPHVRSEREVARYTSGNGSEPFGWQGVQELTAQEMARQFLRQFPELARAGLGDDWAYAGWLTRLLGEVRMGRLPYFMADWDIDLTRGVPMSQGEYFPLPPGLNIEARNQKNDEEEDDIDEEFYDLEEPLLDKTVTPTPVVENEPEPEPSDFDFMDLYSRTHGLIALYHQGESHLLQVTQMIWQLLPKPRTASATQLCVMANQDGKGKLGLHKLLENYLAVADKACERAAATTDENWQDMNGKMDWAKVEHTFAVMDEALLKEAFYISQLIEQVVNPSSSYPTDD